VPVLLPLVMDADCKFTVEGAQTAAGFVMVSTGKGFTVTFVTADVAEQLFVLVAVTVYAPLLATDMAESVEPLLHLYVLPPLAVSVTDPPEQKLKAPPAEILTTGRGLMVSTVAADVAEQLFASVTVTV
jgi:hypothetical protein